MREVHGEVALFTTSTSRVRRCRSHAIRPLRTGAVLGIVPDLIIDTMVDLVIGKMVAIETNYTEETTDSCKCDFWVAKVIALGIPEQQVRVKWYHTGTKNNLVCPQAVYRQWTGSGDTEWIPVCRILAQFELNEKNRIGAAVRRNISNAIRRV